MTAERNIVQRAVHGLIDVLEWIRDTLADETARRAVLADLGLPVTAPPPAPDFAEQLDNLDRYRQQVDPDLEAFLSAWGDLVACLDALDTMLVAAGARRDEDLKELTFQLFSLLATDWMRLRIPTVYFLARLLAVFEEQFPKQFYGTAEAAGGAVGSPLETASRIKFYVVDTLNNPGDYLKRAFPAPETVADAETLAERTLLPLAALFAFFEALPNPEILYSWERTPAPTTPLADALSRTMLSFSFKGQLAKAEPSEGTITERAGATFAWVPREHGGPGLFVALHGAHDVTANLSDEWQLKLGFRSASAVDFFIHDDGIDVAGPSDAAASLAVETRRKSDAVPHVFRVASGTRLEIGKFSVEGKLGADGASIKVVASDSALLLAMQDSDPVLQSVIPSKEVRFAFVLGLGVATGRGLFLEGSSNLELALAVNASYGPVQLRQIYMRLDTGSSGKGVRFETALTLELRLGRLKAIVDRIGFKAESNPNSRGAPIVGYRIPNGIGLTIESRAVSGGGYLFFDPSLDAYGGTVQLGFEMRKAKWQFQAVCFISTNAADGSGLFSLLFIGSLTRNLPQPSPGFRLTALGLIGGYNRTADVEAMRAGLKSGALDTILFPKNPVADAPRIIRTLQGLLPPRRDQFLFGISARFEYGVPTVLTIEVALLMDFPDPTRLLLLGQLHALMPTETRPVIRLHLDAVGVIDFDRGTLALDAVLYDSRVLTHVITGDMALRAGFGDGPSFLLAVGGFNPRFIPPAGFPKLERAAITLNKGDSARIRLEAYFALTSNTAQVGARLELLVRSGGFSVDGHLGFDALFQFSPFAFVVDITAGVTLKWHGRTLLGVELALTLSGPSPWHARGKATFKIWRFSKSVSFDRTFGADEPPPALPPADPLPELLEALRNPRSWSAVSPLASSSLFALRDRPVPEGVLIDPTGELRVSQRVVPLKISIERFGNTAPSGERRFVVEIVDPDGHWTDRPTPVMDLFAPGQFLDLSDAERLSRPSFEPMEAGLRFGGELSFGGETNPDLVGSADLEYEIVIPGAEEAPPPPEAPTLTVGELRTLLVIDRSRPLPRRSGAARYQAPSLAVAAPAVRYRVVSTRDLAPVDLPELAAATPSYTAAAEGLWRHLAAHPERRGELQVATVLEETP